MFLAERLFDLSVLLWFQTGASDLLEESSLTEANWTSDSIRWPKRWPLSHLPLLTLCPKLQPWTYLRTIPRVTFAINWQNYRFRVPSPWPRIFKRRGTHRFPVSWVEQTLTELLYFSYDFIKGKLFIDHFSEYGFAGVEFPCFWDSKGTTRDDVPENVCESFDGLHLFVH